MTVEEQAEEQLRKAVRYLGQAPDTVQIRHEGADRLFRVRVFVDRCRECGTEWRVYTTRDDLVQLACPFCAQSKK